MEKTAAPFIMRDVKSFDSIRWKMLKSSLKRQIESICCGLKSLFFFSLYLYNWFVDTISDSDYTTLFSNKKIFLKSIIQNGEELNSQMIYNFLLFAKLKKKEKKIT